MARSRTDLPRNPKTSGLIPAVRASHRGYQTYGNTARNVVRATARDLSVYAVHVELDRLGSRLIHGESVHPTRTDYANAKTRLLSAYPSDTQLRSDVRKVRYNNDGPPTVDDAALAVVTATRQFRDDVDATKHLGRRAKRRARAQAWDRLHAVLSAIELTLLSVEHPHVEALAAVARGSLR